MLCPSTLHRLKFGPAGAIAGGRGLVVCLSPLTPGILCCAEVTGVIIFHHLFHGRSIPVPLPAAFVPAARIEPDVCFP